MTHRKRPPRTSKQRRQRVRRRERERRRRKTPKAKASLPVLSDDASNSQNEQPERKEDQRGNPDVEQQWELKKERRQRKKRLERAERQSKASTTKVSQSHQARDTNESEDEPRERKKSRKQKKEVEYSDLKGLKYFEKLGPRFAPLHEYGCERDTAGNRRLHYDQFCMGMLMALFNPIVDSLRGLDQATTLAKVQERLGVERMSVGSMSEAARTFDAEELKPLIEDLANELKPLGKDPRLTDIRRTITLVDGTLLKTLPKILQAVVLKQEKGSALVKWRLHTQFEVDRYVPTRIDVTPDGGGEYDERAVMETTVVAGRCYVMDRGYAKFTLLNAIHLAPSSYVCRIRDNSAYQVIEERPLTDDDRAAHVIRDAIVELGATSKKDARPDHKIRLVIVKTEPHAKRGKYKGGSTGPGSDGYLRIATDLLDVPAEIIALIYQYRWSIELFFRFFKQILGCRHLFFRNENGIKLQVYCAIIASMLFCLWTGRRPNKRTYEMVCYYFLGLATEEELQGHLRALPAQELPYSTAKAA
jgi:hypothetical protein